MGSYYNRQPQNAGKNGGCCLWYILGAVLLIILAIFLIDQIPPLAGALSHRLALAQLGDYYALKRDTDGSTEVVAQNGIVRAITTDIPTIGASTMAKVTSALAQYPDLFGLNYFKDQFVLVSEAVLDNGHMLVTFDQVYNGVPVYQSQIKVELDQSGNLISLNGGYVPNLVDFDTTPEINGRLAFTQAVEYQALSDASLLSEPQLVIYDQVVFGEGKSNPTLSWQVEMTYADGLPSECLINAQTGEFIDCSAAVNYALPPTTYLDAGGKEIPAAVKSIETLNAIQADEPGNADQINEVIRNLEYAQLYFEADHAYQCDPYCPDQLQIVLNIGEPNAAIAPIYNETTGQHVHFYFFAPHFTNPDIVTHEYTHGVFRTLLGDAIIQSVEASAINEGLADSFAALSDPVDPWVIESENGILRTIAVETGSEIYHYNDLLVPNDNFTDYFRPDWRAEFSHRNSTILSHAVYLLSEGGESRNGRVTVDGIGMEKAAFILYKTMTRVTPNVTFMQFRSEAHFMCETYISPDTVFDQPLSDEECDQVLNAFAAVGIGEPAALRRANLERRQVPGIMLNNLEESIRKILENWTDKLTLKVEEETINLVMKTFWDILNHLVKVITTFFNTLT